METENEQNSYTVKTANFEGPFALLLDLVEKRKLFINDISLAAVTEDYLEHMNKLGGSHAFHHADMTSFILIASTLILIKSKSLLPGLELTAEEESDIQKLEERLRLYKLFTQLSGGLKSHFGKRVIFMPLERKGTEIVFLPDDQITKESMMTFAKNVLGSMPKPVFLPEVEVRKVLSIEEVIDKLTERIQSALTLSFKEFSGKTTKGSHSRDEKVYVIVSFLAMLELVRNGILDAIQEDHSSDILIERTQNHE